MVKLIFRVVFGYPMGGILADGFQGRPGAGPGRAQPGFELAEGAFDGIETGRRRRQIKQADTADFDDFSQASHFLGRLVVAYDHVAGYQRRAENLLAVGGEDVPARGPARGHGRLQTFLRACNFTKRLKGLHWLTPYKIICNEWRKNPGVFTRDSTHHPPGPYN